MNNKVLKKKILIFLEKKPDSAVIDIFINMTERGAEVADALYDLENEKKIVQKYIKNRYVYNVNK